MSHDTQVKQEAPERIWIKSESVFPSDCGNYYRQRLSRDPSIEYVPADLLATVRREAQTSFVNNIAAALDADDVEAFATLIMKAKASPDLNSDTRSALKSEAEIRREEREAAFKDAITLVQSVTNENALDDGGFFEAGFIAARTKSIDALIEASASEKEGMK